MNKKLEEPCRKLLIAKEELNTAWEKLNNTIFLYFSDLYNLTNKELFDYGFFYTNYKYDKGFINDMFFNHPKVRNAVTVIKEAVDGYKEEIDKLIKKSCTPPSKSKIVCKVKCALKSEKEVEEEIKNINDIIFNIDSVIPSIYDVENSIHETHGVMKDMKKNLATIKTDLTKIKIDLREIKQHLNSNNR